MGRRKVHGEATAAALLDAAESILEAEGLEALSVRRVADRIGTTTRAVYSSLGSKEALLAELGNRGFDMLDAEVMAVPRSDNPAADLLRVTIEGFRAWTLAHPALFRLGFEHRLALPPDVAERFQPAAERASTGLIEVLSRLQAAGGLGTRTVAEATRQVHALCEGLALRDLRCGPDEISAQRWADALTALTAGWRITEPAAPAN